MQSAVKSTIPSYIPLDCDICITNKISTTQITCTMETLENAEVRVWIEDELMWGAVESRPAPPVLLSKAQGLHYAVRGPRSDPDWDDTYLWVAHSSILVGKLVCNLSNLTQLIKGQQKTYEPMTQTTVGTTKCKFPHPTDHFKFTFDRNTHNNNILFVVFALPKLPCLQRGTAEGLQTSSI